MPVPIVLVSSLKQNYNQSLKFLISNIFISKAEIMSEGKNLQENELSLKELKKKLDEAKQRLTKAEEEAKEVERQCEELAKEVEKYL